MNHTNWWQTAVFYQIYPRSFCDSNDDGIGDIPGIISKLDYLKDLGIEAIWLSPHYPSPMIDCGYDISDYEAVAPEYGTMDDFKQLIKEIHDKKMFLVTDLVLNHTSNEHVWFKESRSSKFNPKRDWYIWEPGDKNNPPNKWFSTFGGSAWEFDSSTHEYYYHFFFKEQPDLNWRNPEVKKAMFNMVRFWLDLGVDGFRLDAIGTIFEDPGYPNQKSDLTLDEFYKLNRTAVSETERKANWQQYEELFSFQHDQPGIHELMKELRAVVDEYDQRVLIGETDDISFYGNGDDELHMVFNFPLMKSDRLTAITIQKNQAERLGAIPLTAWPCNTLGNHDSSRMINRFGDGVEDEAIARINLVALLAIKGTPVLYNGEEIGMYDALNIPLTQLKDPLGIRAYRLERELMGSSEEQARLFASYEGRDKCRTPMQWKNDPNAGFCSENISPWLPVNENYSNGVNVQDQQEKDDSLLNFYRQILLFRKKCKPLREGDMEFLQFDNPELLCIRRFVGAESVIIGINFSNQGLSLPAYEWEKIEFIFRKNFILSFGREYLAARIGPYGFFIGLPSAGRINSYSFLPKGELRV